MAARDCWNCGKDAHQTLHGDPFRESGRPEGTLTWSGAFRCDFCGFGSIGQVNLDVSEVKLSSHHLFTQAAGDSNILSAVKQALDAPDADVTWHPHRSLGRRFDDVPHPIDAAASEAWACYSIGQYRASVLMARSVVEATAKACQSERGNLMTKIDDLYKREVVGRGVKEAAHEIRFLGNKMAHGDFVVDVTEAECADILNFLEEFLNEVYQRDARLSRFRAQRLGSNEATDPAESPHGA